MKSLIQLPSNASLANLSGLRWTAWLFVLLMIAATGCSDNPVGPDEPTLPPPSEQPAPAEPASAPAPGITMSSVNVTITDGSAGLQFFARANQDVFYKKVKITPPPPFDAITYNLNNTFVIEEQSIALQGANTAYLRLGGRWTFTFEVTAGTGANALDHTVTVSFDVAGKNDAAPGASAGLVIGGS